MAVTKPLNQGRSIFVRETVEITVTSGSGSATTTTGFDHNVANIVIYRDSGSDTDSFKAKITETDSGIVRKGLQTHTGQYVSNVAGRIYDQWTIAISSASPDGTYYCIIDYLVN